MNLHLETERRVETWLQALRAHGLEARESSPPGALVEVALEDVHMRGFRTGINMGKGVRIRSKGLVIEGCEVGIDNSGEFLGPDTIIK
jgi:hypothetical protein